MNYKLAIFMTFIFSQAARSDEYFYKKFPECKVFLEQDCTSRYEFIGERLDCYRSFISRSSTCKKKSRGYLEEWKTSLIQYEQKKFLNIKNQASETLEKNYEIKTGVKIDQFYAGVAEKSDGVVNLRALLSYMNRVSIPATERMNSEFTILLQKFKTTQTSSITDAEGLLKKIETFIGNYEAYKQEYQKNVIAIKNDNVRSGLVDAFEKTRFLVLDLYNMQSALTDIIDQLKDNQRKKDITSIVASTVSKSEVILRKLRQLRDAIPADQEEINFYQRICEIELEDRKTLCKISEGDAK